MSAFDFEQWQRRDQLRDAKCVLGGLLFAGFVAFALCWACVVCVRWAVTG